MTEANPNSKPAATSNPSPKSGCFSNFDGFCRKMHISKPVFFFIVFSLPLILVFLLIAYMGVAYPKPAPQPPVEQAKDDFLLTLTSPTEGELAIDDEILVAGQTLPGSTVVVFDEIDEDSVISDEAGYFEGTLLLDTGINSVNVTVFAEDGREKTVALDIVRDVEI